MERNAGACDDLHPLSELYQTVVSHIGKNFVCVWIDSVYSLIRQQLFDRSLAGFCPSQHILKKDIFKVNYISGI